MTDPLEPFRESVEEMAERGIRQAEYENLMQTVDWRVVNTVVQTWLSRMCDALYEEFGIRELTERTVMKNYIKVRSSRVQQRRGRL